MTLAQAVAKHLYALSIIQGPVERWRPHSDWEGGRLGTAARDQSAGVATKDGEDAAQAEPRR